MAEYCAADPRRLKSMVLAPATDPAASARAIEKLAKDDWVAAVWPLLPEGLPLDDPDLEPIWAAANAADLPGGQRVADARAHAGRVRPDGPRLLRHRLLGGRRADPAVSLGERATQKLMWENAARFFRLTSTPW